MPAFLSSEWLAALASALARAPVAAREPFPPFTFHQRVTGAPDGVCEYGVTVAADGIRVAAASARSGDLVCITDYPTAVALHRGELTAQEALASGRLEVRGRLEQLTAARKVLVALDDSARELRSTTTYDPVP